VRSLADALELPEDERAALFAAVPKRGRGDYPAPAAVPHQALPVSATPLVGRERDLEEVAYLLRRLKVRLLTLTGTGGVGKTRLAIQVARDAADLFPDGVEFVALAPLNDPTLVISTIARSLGLREAENQSPGETLRAYLRDKRLLLVLDNFEHLVEAAPELTELIEWCPDLLVLVTSRATLRVRGEQEYAVAPLALPASTRSPAAEEVVSSPSGRLFVERARAAAPAFELDEGNASSVASICWRVAGLPLALELAAARVRFLSPSSLLTRLDRALSAGWVRDFPERQRTMQTTLNWSHDLLNEPEQVLFRRLSVFSGGFTLEAAEAVGAAGSVGVEDLVDLLGTLVEQSLVVAEPSSRGYEARYGMLEPVRQYAREMLEQSGEGEDILRRHAEFFVDLSERAMSEFWGQRQDEWLERLERENDNLRAAMGWALEAREAEIGARFGWALYSFWWVRGYHREGRRWIEATLESPLPLALRARALVVAAIMAYAQGDYSTAEQRWEETLRLSRSEGDTLAEAMAWVGSGLIEMVRSDYEAAASSIEKALPLFDRCDQDASLEGYGYDPQGEAALARVFLGTTLLARGDLEGAERRFEEGLKSARCRGNPLGTYVGLYNLAQVAVVRGDPVLATRTLEEGIRLSGQTKDRANLAHFLDALAAIASSQGEAERCTLLLGAAEALLEELGARVYNFYQPDPSLRERAVAEARAVLGESAFEGARERGRAMTFEQAVKYALEREEPSPT
jgi:predicted ATPase